MNRIILAGRLGSDPEIKQTPSGVKIAQFSVAVDREYKNPEGGRDTDWFRCVAWRERADFIESYVGKGRSVVIVGRMQSSRYEDKHGTLQTGWDVQVDSIKPMDRAPDGSAAPHPADQEDPFNE